MCDLVRFRNPRGQSILRARRDPRRAANTESGRGGHGTAPGTEGFALTTPPVEERGGPGAAGAPFLSPFPPSLPVPPSLPHRSAPRSRLDLPPRPGHGSRRNSGPASRESGRAGRRNGGIMSATPPALP